MLGCSHLLPSPVKLPLFIILPLLDLAGTYRAQPLPFTLNAQQLNSVHTSQNGRNMVIGRCIRFLLLL